VRAPSRSSVAGPSAGAPRRLELPANRRTTRPAGRWVEGTDRGACWRAVTRLRSIIAAAPSADRPAKPETARIVVSAESRVRDVDKHGDWSVIRGPFASWRILSSTVTPRCSAACIIIRGRCRASRLQKACHKKRHYRLRVSPAWCRTSAHAKSAGMLSRGQGSRTNVFSRLGSAVAALARAGAAAPTPWPRRRRAGFPAADIHPVAFALTARSDCRAMAGRGGDSVAAVPDVGLFGDRRRRVRFRCFSVR